MLTTIFMIVLVCYLASSVKSLNTYQLMIVTMKLWFTTFISQSRQKHVNTWP